MKKQNNESCMISHCAEMVDIIGKTPYWLSHWGMVSLIAIILGVLLCCFLIKYPMTVKSQIKIEMINTMTFFEKDNTSKHDLIGKVDITDDEADEVYIGQNLEVCFPGYPIIEYGVLEGVVASIIPSREDYKGCCIEVSFPNGLVTTKGVEVPYTKGLSGSAEIITRQMRLIDIIIAPIQQMFNLAFNQ